MKRTLIFAEREIRRCYGRDPEDVKTTRQWYEKFQETGSVGVLPRSGWQTESEENVDFVRRSYRLSPTKSTSRVSHELRILHQECLNFSIKDFTFLYSGNCSGQMAILDRIAFVNDYLNIVHEHNVPICGSQNQSFFTDRDRRCLN